MCTTLINNYSNAYYLVLTLNHYVILLLLFELPGPADSKLVIFLIRGTYRK